MKNLFVLFLTAGMFFAVSCGQRAATEAAAEQAKQDSIAQAAVEQAKQDLLDSLAIVAEEEAIQARMDSLENALKEQETKVQKSATTPAPKKTTVVEKEPEQAKPTRAGATKRDE